MPYSSDDIVVKKKDGGCVYKKEKLQIGLRGDGITYPIRKGFSEKISMLCIKNIFQATVFLQQDQVQGTLDALLRTDNRRCHFPSGATTSLQLIFTFRQVYIIMFPDSLADLERLFH